MVTLFVWGGRINELSTRFFLGSKSTLQGGIQEQQKRFFFTVKYIYIVLSSLYKKKSYISFN